MGPSFETQSEVSVENLLFKVKQHSHSHRTHAHCENALYNMNLYGLHVANMYNMRSCCQLSSQPQL